MANPRKFSEKIALHNQKQAEETAAFEAILREVSATTRPKPQPPPQPAHHIHLQQPTLGTYRGGSLPNVNQIGNNSIDLQSALNSLEDMKQSTGRQSLVDRLHRGDRSRQVQAHRRGPFPFDKRVDCSPYGSPYLSPPPDTSWRRTNSDSALHTSTMGPQQHQQQRAMTPQGRMDITDGQLEVDGNQMWDPKNLSLQSRPKSCEVPGINIYPSPDQDGGVHIPISNNTGSLPDLTNLHFPPPLTTPLDPTEEANNYGGQGGSPGNLSPTAAHHMTGHGGQSTSPGSRRRHTQGAPSPLVLQGSPTQLRHNMQGNALDVNSVCLDRQTYHPYHLPQAAPHGGRRQVSPSATNGAHAQQHVANHTASSLSPNRAANLSPCQRHLHVNNHRHRTQGNMSQYRNNGTTECPQSPTSPHSQPSYSPSQSPGLPPTTLSSSPFSEAYYLQQQAQTQALQHQFEQFNMVQDPNAVVTTNGMAVSMYSLQSSPGGTVHLSQAAMADLVGVVSSAEFNHNTYYSQSPQQPSSPQQQHSPGASPSPVSQSAPTAFPPSPTHQQIDLSFNQNNKIPDIIFTGADDHMRQDFAKEISSAMAGMPDSFDSDLFLNDETLRDGLDPLDLQMLTDPNIVTDPATEDSFRLDRL